MNVQFLRWKLQRISVSSSRYKWHSG